ncbi:cytochrome d ubiquinol oxidase subunit II [Biformimicrobium ophioploci]|uniref:Cytochrome d ubiquinol oxidase subunit II n=1 Tax=Biformimicrobium ophioploci TaxID=3036711 RepID=A0ABQ6LYL8_9GAMM|nr:cytochrome d ubiquinol oxidase subunit II [Microbulbifer sp. NKW57]GMG87140.1 cytochrome d ubiquinol oxidase subunit II [Microbulbifer sp. NKW57]
MMDDHWLPVIFIALMGLAVLIYAVLDGFDLGVGILLPFDAGETSSESQRDTMIASIGPFWDANETWLVLAIGLLLIAFPHAHSVVMYHLYIPIAIMLIGLILRGVAFDFRAKAAVSQKLAWDRTFKAGSLLTSLSQGFMLGQYVMGFDTGWQAMLFAAVSALGVTAAYSYIGATWLALKTEGALRQRALHWARRCGRICFAGVVAVSVINPLVNPGVFARWFEYPLVMFVLLIPALCFAAFIWNDMTLRRQLHGDSRHVARPFFVTALIFALCFTGLAFSFFPEIVPGRMDIWEAASAPESLRFILVGAVLVVPVILAYTAFSYYVFRGKTTELRYH